MTHRQSSDLHYRQRQLIALLLTVLLTLTGIGSAYTVSNAQTPRPDTGTVTANSNLRAGPSTTFAVVGSAAQGTRVGIFDCNADCSWYQLDTGEWIAAFLVDTDSAPVADTASAQPITFIGWNVESGGALQPVVSERIAAFDDVDIWGLSEVEAVDAEDYELAAEDGENADFASLLGTTGRADRLLLIWDSERFTQVDSGEMLTIGETGRAPLWVQLYDRANDVEFIVMVNHLHRSNDNIRHRQARALNAWAASQELPVIALGDYNFDWNLPNGDADHDLGYDNLVADGVWEWLRPAQLVTTQCSGWPCRYNSILDFTFVAGAARDWQGYSEIVVTQGDFPDDFSTPDHRPVLAVLTPTLGTGTVAPSVGVTYTPTPSPTPTPTATPTAVVVVCPQTEATVNQRSGPSTGYAVVGSARAGQCLDIVGRTETGDWYRLNNGNWLAAFLVINAPAAAMVPVVATPTPLPPTPTPAAPACDPNYAGACIPVVSYDLNCGDIPFSGFRVVGSDRHNFDGDGDGIGCEISSAPPTPVPSVSNCDPNYAGACIPLVGYDLDCGEIPFRRFQSIGSDPHWFDGDGDGLACE